MEDITKRMIIGNDMFLHGDSLFRKTCHSTVLRFQAYHRYKYYD